MSKSAPAIPLFGDAYMADTTHLTLEENGAYLKLMMVAWRLEGCALPNDDSRLARILGITAGRWAKLKPVVMAFWTLTSAGWIQARLCKERNFVEEKRAINKSSADARWAAKSIENIQHDECERISERNAPPPTPPQEKESKCDASASLRAAPEPVAEAFDAWNEVAAQTGWPTLVKRSGTRQAAMRSRLREDGIEGWRSAIARARASPFLGSDPPPSFMSFDWLTKTANFTKVIEGNYDRQRQSDISTTRQRFDPVSPSLAFLRFAETLDDDPPPNGESGTGYRALGAGM